MLDLNHYRPPPHAVWDRIESNPFVQALVVLCLTAIAAAQLR